MEITIHRLDRENHQLFDGKFLNIEFSRIIKVDFSYLSQVDVIGFNSFLKLKRNAEERGMYLQCIGMDNFQLQQFLKTIQLENFCTE